MVPLQTYLSDMALLDTGSTCHNKNEQSLNSLYEFEYCIEEMKHTSDRGILHTYYTIFIVYTGYLCKLPGLKHTKLIGASPGVGWGENFRWKGSYSVNSDGTSVSNKLEECHGSGNVNNLFCLYYVLVKVARAKTHSAAQYKPRRGRCQAI